MNKNGEGPSHSEQDPHPEPDPRPEELIVDIYRQRDELAASGDTPSRVVISMTHYRGIQAYHSQLGEIAEGQSDYIDKYRLFDLEICIEDVDWPRVETPTHRSDGPQARWVIKNRAT